MRRARQMHCLSLLALAMVLVMMSLAVRAQSSRIAFSSDREQPPDLDIWLSNDDGSQQVLFGDKPDDADNRRRPSICTGGQRIFYDDSSDFPSITQGDLWVKSTSGGGAAQEALHCTNPGGAPDCFGQRPDPFPWCGVPPLNPPPVPETGGDCGCRAVACGSPPSVFFPTNSRILFEYMNPPGTRHNILMATWDASSGSLGALCKLTHDGGTAESLRSNFEPAWCGNNHMVFTRTNHEYEEGVLLGPTICTKAIPTTEPTEIRCHITDDGLDERYPSCGMKNGEWTVAYAMQKTGAPSDVSRICTINLDQTTFDFIPGTEVCTPEDELTVDWTRPTWSPGGTQIAFASNENVGSPGEDDYDIYRIGSDTISLQTGSPIFAHPSNTDEDDDPDWGPALLGQ